MGWNWKANSMESADSNDGWTPPPEAEQPPPARAAATGGARPPPPPRAQATAAPQKTESIWKQAGDFIFGNAEKPGIVGTGQYGVNVPTVRLGAGNIPGVEQSRAMLAQGAQDAKTRQVGTDFRNAQMGLMSELQAATRGEGPSVAQEQLRQGTEANLAATVAAANSIRGTSAATQAGQLAATRAQATQQMASDAGILRAQEIAQARGQLAGVAQGARGQDIDSQAQADELVRYYTSQGLDLDKAQQAAAMEMERLRVGTALQGEGLKMGSYDSSATRNGQLFRDVANAAGQALGIGAGGKGGK